MTGAQHSRGPRPQDPELFAPAQHERLQAATSDLSWLLERDYALPSALELVGNRYGLTVRQRMAVQRCACTEAQRTEREARRVDVTQLRGRRLAIDGFNVLITLEGALSGGYLFVARDGCVRDVASIHGTYRRVSETDAAIDTVGQALAGWGVAHAVWYLDQPVSNSGRLRARILERAALHGWAWTAEVVHNPGRTLVAETEAVVVSGDSWVIENATCWANLVGELLRAAGPADSLARAHVADLSLDERP